MIVLAGRTSKTIATTAKQVSAIAKLAAIIGRMVSFLRAGNSLAFLRTSNGMNNAVVAAKKEQMIIVGSRVFELSPNQ